ncbi:MAG: sigma-70 family RNA polymerase sigma factor [Armatimonadetes bacterium]|nr:sigma-70 family RNA polymerase sigma factor [Armatimonadota bacterium]
MRRERAATNRNSTEAAAFIDAADLDEQLWEDRRLVEAARHGDGRAYCELVERYHARVYGIIYRMCGPQDAEDLTQDVFVRALHALRRFQFQGHASFRTWLYRIAVNSAINELRRRGRANANCGPSLDELDSSESGATERILPDYSYAPHVLIEREELRRAVHETLRQLPANHRAVIVLVDLEGLPYEEAAQILGCPLGTVKSRLARARAAFARIFRRYLHGNMRVGLEYQKVKYEPSGQ